MAEYGERFYRPGDRKITLNFALANEMMVDQIGRASCRERV